MTNQMIIGLGAFSSAGSDPRSWQHHESLSKTYPDFEGQIRMAQTAERGKFHFLFFGDFPGQISESNEAIPQMAPDPLISIAAAAMHTSAVGFAATMATEWHSPFNIARQFKALDALSGGRIAWNAVTGSNRQAAALYGKTLPSSTERYGRAEEFVQIVQSYWASWEKGALEAGDGERIFADYNKLKPVSFRGHYLSAQGVLPIPPTPQGQPVMFHSGGSPNSIAFAARYADVYITQVWTVADAVRQRRQLRQAAVATGRSPDDVKFIAGLSPVIANSKREALDKHSFFVDTNLRQQLNYMSMIFGTEFTTSDLERAIPQEIINNAKHGYISDPRQPQVVAIAEEGWNLRDVINHSVINYHPTVLGTAQDVIDHMKLWFSSGAADGFWVLPDTHDADLVRFVDEVVPVLQKEELFHKDYMGSTLRENLGLREQYGIDPRIVKEI